MIEGVIQDSGTPALPIRVIGKRESGVTLTGILDTGFDGFLSLPTAIAVTLGLERIDTTDTELADGTIVEDELIFAGRAEWDGTVVGVRISLTQSEDVLIGTGFLEGYRVELDYVSRAVKITKAP